MTAFVAQLTLGPGVDVTSWTAVVGSTIPATFAVVCSIVAEVVVATTTMVVTTASTLAAIATTSAASTACQIHRGFRVLPKGCRVTQS